MIKNYKQYNESLRDLMVGPTDEEIFNSIKELSPNYMLIKSCQIGFPYGVKYALEHGIKDVNSIKSDGVSLLTTIVNKRYDEEIKYEILNILFNNGYSIKEFSLSFISDMIYILDDGKLKKLIHDKYYSQWIKKED